jgi:hypothetical protein
MCDSISHTGVNRFCQIAVQIVLVIDGLLLLDLHFSSLKNSKSIFVFQKIVILKQFLRHIFIFKSLDKIHLKKH